MAICSSNCSKYFISVPKKRKELKKFTPPVKVLDQSAQPLVDFFFQNVGVDYLPTHKEPVPSFSQISTAYCKGESAKTRRRISLSYKKYTMAVFISTGLLIT